MEDKEQKLNTDKARKDKIASVKHEKTSVEKRVERIQQIDAGLKSFNNDNSENIAEIEAKRLQEFNVKKQSLEKAGIPISDESKKLIHKNMVDDHIDFAIKENERFDKLKIEKIVLENVDNPDSQLVKRLFPENADKVSDETFFSALEKICEANVKTPVCERVQMFREALEYFSEKEKLEYSVAHATGSDSLRRIIEDKQIKEGGTGESGEASGQSRSGEQKGVSVAEMNHPMADYVELFYGRMGANKEITKEVLKIDANVIDGKTPVDDFMQICLDFIDTDKFLEAVALKSGDDVESIKAKIAKEAGKKEEDINRDDIKKSKLVEEVVFGSIEKIAKRKHYMTAERAKRDYEAFNNIIQMCEKCEKGEFPEIKYSGKTYQNPEEIIELKHDIYELEDDDLVEKKMLIEMQNEYAYFLRPYFNKEENKWIEPRYTIDKFYSNSSEILKEYAEWIKNGRTFKTLLSLHVLENDPEEIKIKKAKRLKELDSQYPSMIIIEGKEYKEKGLTHTDQEGSRPVPFFEVEERINSDISFQNIKEIVVPRAKIDEVKKWLADSGIKDKDMPKMVAFEYFEIKRIINHQLKGTTDQQLDGSTEKLIKTQESLIRELLDNNPELAKIYSKRSVKDKLFINESGQIVSDGQIYENNSKMRALIELAGAIRKSLPDVQDGYIRLWRGNRPNEVAHNPSYTNSLEGIALPFLRSYAGVLSYIDIPKEEEKKYLTSGAKDSEFILPPEIVKKVKIVGFTPKETKEIIKKSTRLPETENEGNGWSSV